MTSITENPSVMDRKNAMRRRAYDARNAQRDKDLASRFAIQRCLELSEYRQSKTVMWYLDCRSELRTQLALQQAMVDAPDQTFVVPYCTEDEQGQNKLGLWRLESFSELVVGKWKILEPPRDHWGSPEKEVPVESIDFVMVPGVGFGRDGARMGNGQGYYDRLLERVRHDCHLVALCYECQLFDDLVVGPHDVYMDKVVTEQRVYPGRGREAKRAT